MTSKELRGQGRTTDFPRLLGGHLCLHFANTVEGPISDRPEDFLKAYDDLVRWSWHAAVIPDTEEDRLLSAARRRPDAAASAFTRALALRDTVDRVFREIARGGPPAAGELALLQKEYVAAMSHARLTAVPAGYEWAWTAATDLDRPIWAIARSAVDVLTTADLTRIKECPGAADCGWLFYDTSRNGSRRWCSMEGCGSRVKMRRHYDRHR